MEVKYCKRCDTTKPIGEFGKQKNRPDGLRFYCKPCNSESYKTWYYADTEKSRAVSKRWRDDNPEKRQKIWVEYRLQDKHLKLIKGFGISLQTYLNMLDLQQERCRICERHMSMFKRMLSVDHDRQCCSGSKSCGKCIRGLLCGNCNTALGLFSDDPDRMRRAIKYVQKELG